MSGSVTSQVVAIPHVVKGQVQLDATVEYGAADGERFATPAIDLDSLVWSRTEPLPLSEVPVAEIIDLLVATGEQLQKDPNGHVAEALENLVRTSPYERRILENAYEDLHLLMTGDRLWAQLNGELGGADIVDGWRRLEGAGLSGAIRAYPTRIVHVLAGNAPPVAAMTVIRGALVKGVHLLKMPSNDLLTATAILRAMGEVAPDHPIVQSFSAVYWRGGDTSVESVLFRPQFFDKLVAWGGDSAIRNAAKFLGPGLELISFDPKNSISLIGREALESPETMADAAERAAIAATPWNQEACASSRYQFIEGDVEDVDRFCELLQVALGKDRRYTSAVVPPLPSNVNEEVEALRSLEPLYRVFGSGNGRGLVVRSDEPVEFFPSNKTVNVVMVPKLEDAVKYVGVATQTVGIYPIERKEGLRNILASAGVQRTNPLGTTAGMIPGGPHDGFNPLQRFVKWVADEDENG
ncbi:MAG: long-chain-fatty-acyl-CoA reductase [Actinomycetota bacterium]|nr:MAG: long-chain-fatty-acyl-CoA reductase [Actinomycetota bacterium]